MEKLFKKLSELKSDFDKKRENNRFNIITALHKERDEVYLHSRIISYLLSPTSGHGMSDKYLQIFVRDILKLENETFNLSQVLVLPNEYKKSEYKEIDLLIVNKSTSQAIIIENKIDAKDSNHTHKLNINDSVLGNLDTTKIGARKTNKGYIGQLERYYNTIKLGIDKDGNECKEHQCDQVFVYYLSLNKAPTEISVGMLAKEPSSWKQENILSYGTHIREWLSKCISITPNEKIQVKNFIQHYSNVIDRLTHNDIPMEERTKLKNIIAENIANSKYLIENFKHVKWHTAHEFWTELKNNLESKYEEVTFFVDGNIDFNRAVEEVTHQSKEIHHGLVFNISDNQIYISGFGKLSWGIVNPKKWSPFINEGIEDINFSDFTSENTYLLINKDNMLNAVKVIVEEIKTSINNNFKNLRGN